MHFVPEYFLHPVHKIRVTLVGAGGNGSQMLSSLARINHALRALGEPGLTVTVYDPDTVEAPNVGRQLFSEGEIGINKAECLVSRFNRIFGLDWTACPKRYDAGHDPMGNIIITCVDNVATRLQIGQNFRNKNITKAETDRYHKTHGGKAFNEYNEHYTFYWLDLGNAQRTGQAVLGANRIPQPKSQEYDTVEYLPTAAELLGLSKVKEEDSGPSCSMAEALSRQDLFINSALVTLSSSLLWSILTDLAVDTQGVFVNLDSYRAAPIPVKAENVDLTPGRRRKPSRKVNPESKDNN